MKYKDYGKALANGEDYKSEMTAAQHALYMGKRASVSRKNNTKRSTVSWLSILGIVAALVMIGFVAGYSFRDNSFPSFDAALQTILDYALFRSGEILNYVIMGLVYANLFFGILVLIHYLSGKAKIKGVYPRKSQSFWLGLLSAILIVAGMALHTSKLAAWMFNVLSIASSSLFLLAHFFALSISLFGYYEGTSTKTM